VTKYNAGLHKDVSAIFDGVAITRNNAAGANMSRNHNKVPASAAQPKHPLIPMTRKNAPEKTAGQQWALQTFLEIKNKLSIFLQSGDNPRQKILTILMPFLLIVLVWGIIHAFNSSPTMTVKAKTVTPTPAPVRITEKKWGIPEPYPSDIRDPMQSVSATFVTTTGLQSRYQKVVVKGIVYSDDNPAAIIGSEIVNIGETVSGATVIKINEDSVEFEMNGQRWTQKVQN
jgi:hypothetical protein